MTDKFTPGPWRYYHPAQHVWKIRDASGSLIADYHGANSDDNPQNEANARLIAQAPNLYALLNAASHALRSYQHGNSAPDLAKGLADDIDLLLSDIRGD